MSPIERLNKSLEYIEHTKRRIQAIENNRTISEPDAAYKFYFNTDSDEAKIVKIKLKYLKSMLAVAVKCAKQLKKEVKI